MAALIKLNPFEFFEKLKIRFRQKPRLEIFHHLTARLSEIKTHPTKVEVEIKELSTGDEEILEQLAQIKVIGYTREQLIQFLTEGRRCYIALHNGRVASCYWILRKGFTYHRYFDLAEDEEFQLAGFTDPAFRGMGIIPHLVAVTARERYLNGPDMLVISHVATTNKPSLRTLHKLGFHKDGLVCFFNFFGIEFHFILGKKVFPKTRRRFYFKKI